MAEEGIIRAVRLPTGKLRYPKSEIMEAVKSYRIPVEAPRDLIEEYFKVKQKALDAIFSHVKISKKAHLEFDREDRKRLRDELPTRVEILQTLR